MIEINLTMFLLVIVNRFLFRPTINVIEEREKKITGWEQESLKCRESMQARLENYENQLIDAKERAQQQQEQMTEELKKKEEQELAAVSEEAMRIVASTREKLQDDTEVLRRQLQEQAKEMSQLLAEKILGRKAK